MNTFNPKSQDTELEAPDAMELLAAAKKGGMHGAYAYGLLHSLIAAHDTQRRDAVLAAIGELEREVNRIIGTAVLKNDKNYSREMLDLITAHDKARYTAVMEAIGPNELQHPDPPDSHERRAGRNGLRNELRPKVNAIYGTEEGE